METNTWNTETTNYRQSSSIAVLKWGKYTWLSLITIVLNWILLNYLRVFIPFTSIYHIGKILQSKRNSRNLGDLGYMWAEWNMSIYCPCSNTWKYPNVMGKYRSLFLQLDALWILIKERWKWGQRGLTWNTFTHFLSLVLSHNLAA